MLVVHWHQIAIAAGTHVVPTGPGPGRAAAGWVGAVSPRRTWEPPEDAREYAFRVLLANRLREARERAHLTVRQLGIAIGRDPSHVVRLETRRRTPRVTDLWKIAEATGRTVEQFVAGPRDDDERADWEIAIADFDRGLAAPGGVGRDDERADGD